MDCPRCGFSQPKDRYCANCGIDVDAYHQRPASFFARILNSSNLHLAVIIGVIIATLFYLVVSQRDLIQKEVGKIFDGLPLLSSQAVDQEAVQLNSLPTPNEESQESSRASEATQSFAGEPQGIIEPTPKTKQQPTSPPTVEVRYLEISKENIRALVASGQVIRELENWRVVYLPSSPSIQSLLQASRRLPGSIRQPLPLQGDLEILSGDYDPDPNKSFLNFSMIWRIPDSVDWSLISQMRRGENSESPLVMREYGGKMRWTPQSALIFIFDPIQRVPVSNNTDLNESPLRVLKSQDFQTGLSDLIIWIEVANQPVTF